MLTTNKEMKVVLSTADALKKVRTFYDERLKKDGWHLATTTDVSGTDMSKISMLECRKDHRRLLLLLIRDVADKTSIQITVSEEK